MKALFMAGQQKINVRQYASFLYLQQIKKFYIENKQLFSNNAPPYHQLNAVLKKIESQVAESEEGFDKSIKYQEIYSQFHQAVQKVAEDELYRHDKKINPSDDLLDPFFIQVYENENEIHKKLFNKLNTADPEDEAGKDLQKKIKTLTTDPSKKNFSHPDNPFNAFFTSMLGINYNPLSKNNIPFVNFFEDEDRTNLRIGAQTQQADVVNPPFIRYLLANARRTDHTSPSAQEQLKQGKPKKGKSKQKKSKQEKSKQIESKHAEPKKSKPKQAESKQGKGKGKPKQNKPKQRKLKQPQFKKAQFKPLKIKQEENEFDDEKPYEYVYINLLKRPQDEQTHQKRGVVKKIGDKFVRNSEGRRAAALETLNLRKDLKTAVITLPADNDFLLGKFSMKTGHSKDDSKEPCSTLLKELTDSIRNNKNDFFIPKQVKKRIFIDVFKDPELKELEAKLKTKQFRNDKKVNDRYDELKKQLFEEKISELFIQSVRDILGPDTAEAFEQELKVKDPAGALAAGARNQMLLMLSPEQRSAVIFHFTKFHLTKLILDTLQPRVYNISCKDAIDRGAIHTLWNRMNEKYDRSKEDKDKPMSKEEFLMMLDYPALITKYRTVNANKNLLWNVLSHRMNADERFAKAHPWAVDWLKENEPRKAKLAEKEATLPSYKTKKAKSHSIHEKSPTSLPPQLSNPPRVK